MIKNIVFDVGNIIVKGKPKDALKYIELDEKYKEIIKKVIFENPDWKKLDYGDLDFDEYFEINKDKLPENIIDIAKDCLFKSVEYRKFNENIISLIKKLYENGYKIYILSDNNVNTYNYLKKSELNDYISGWCVSAFYGEVKEEKKLYKILFDTFKLNPDECYFIDDREKNIQIGKEYGMDGFNLDWEKHNYNELIQQMKNKKIEI